MTILKSLLVIWLLIAVECKDDKHFRGDSDTHFTGENLPRLTITLKKLSNNTNITNVVSDDAEVTMKFKEKDKKNSKDDKKPSKDDKTIPKDNEKSDTIEATVKFKTKVKPNVSQEEIYINILTSAEDTYFIKIKYNIYYQIIHEEVGLGCRFLIDDITTNIPNGNVVKDLNNKWLQNTYGNENEIEIQY
jgi:hypothetical protein